MSKDITIIADYTDDVRLTVVEVCEICRIEEVSLYELVGYDILQPDGRSPAEWRFDMQQLMQLRRALRLQRELEINPAGVALVLELLQELEMLRAESRLLRKHLLK